MRIAVTGGTGFVGSHLCNVLNGRGHEVVSFSLNPESPAFPMDEGIEKRKANILDKESFFFEDFDVVIHLVGLTPLFQPRNISYEEIHVEGTRNVLEKAGKIDVDRFVHMSALGADKESNINYLSSKGRAQQLVEDSELEHVIFRPSVIFGEGGEFIELLKDFASKSPVFPLANYGKTKFQPIYIGDIVSMMADAAEGSVGLNSTFEIGGAEVFSLKNILSRVYSSLGKKPRFVPVPNALSFAGLSIAEFVPPAPVGLDQYRSLKLDNVVEHNSAKMFGFEREEDFILLEDYLNKY